MKLIKKVICAVISGAAAFTLMGNTSVILSDTAFDNTVTAADSAEKDTFKLNGKLDANNTYDGCARIWGVSKTGSTGDTIEVPVYMKLGENIQPQTITGIAFKVEYDHEALELVRIMDPDDSAFSDGGFNACPETGVFMYTYTVGNISVDPKYPIVDLRFKIKADKGSYKIHLSNHLFEGSALQLIHRQDIEETTYLKPYTKDFNITVKSDEETSDKAADVKSDGTEKDTFRLNGKLDVNNIYDGCARIWGVSKTGSTGDIIESPVYLKLAENIQPQTITGIAFKAEYDHDALELVRIIEPEDSAFSDGGFNASPQTGVFMYTYTTGNITVDSKYPVVDLRFKIKAEEGTHKIHLSNHLFEGSALQLIHCQDEEKTTYLKPYTKDFNVTVKPSENN